MYKRIFTSMNLCNSPCIYVYVIHIESVKHLCFLYTCYQIVSIFMYLRLEELVNNYLLKKNKVQQVQIYSQSTVVERDNSIFPIIYLELHTTEEK